jgi:hypothetical protein
MRCLNFCSVALFIPLYLLAEEMDRKDEEMREVVKKVWPAQARKMLDNLV